MIINVDKWIFKKNYVYNYLLFQGEYRTVFEKIYLCQSLNSIQTNLYYRKRTSNITEMKGNLTFLVPFDDSHIVSKYYNIIFNNNCKLWHIVHIHSIKYSRISIIRTRLGRPDYRICSDYLWLYMGPYSCTFFDKNEIII